MKVGEISFNWFDFVVLAVLVAGVIRGRRRGMSEELLDVLQWLSIVVVSALYYQPIGRLAAGNAELSLLIAYVCAYLSLVILIKLGFTWLRRMVGEKLIGSDVFGGGEYYLGMAAGAVRFSCVLLVVLALLHAKYVSPEQIAAQKKVQKDNFGDISFPTFSSVQHDVFHGSLAGTFIKRHLSDHLIEATPPGQKLVDHEPLRMRRQREIDEVFGFKK